MIDITSETEFGFSDIVLKVSELKETGNTGLEFLATGRYNKEKVGIRVNLKLKIVSAIADNKIMEDKFTPKAVVFSSTGPESDRLVKALGILYKTETSKNFTAINAVFSASVLKIAPFDLRSESLKLQLNFDEKNEKNMKAQFYLNLDLTNNKIMIEEKNQIFRGNIIKILTQ